MNEEIFLRMKEDYENSKITIPMCIYASTLDTNDLCIWYNQNYLCISDGRDYIKELETSEIKPSIIYETSDEEEIQKANRILGMVDYSKRLTELYFLTTNKNRLSLTKK